MLCVLPVQVVPLPFQQDQQQQQQSESPAATPLDHVIAAAYTAAAVGPLQPFPLRQLPYRAYAVMIDQR